MIINYRQALPGLDKQRVVYTLYLSRYDDEIVYVHIMEISVEFQNSSTANK